MDNPRSIDVNSGLFDSDRVLIEPSDHRSEVRRREVDRLTVLQTDQPISPYSWQEERFE